jgi:hypothetical protein
LKKLKNKKVFFEYGGEKDVLLNFMPKIGMCAARAWKGEWALSS